jgi:hypothetical protein
VWRQIKALPILSRGAWNQPRLTWLPKDLPPPRTAHWAEWGGVRSDRRGMAGTLRTPLFTCDVVGSTVSAIANDRSSNAVVIRQVKLQRQRLSNRPGTQSRFTLGQSPRPGRSFGGPKAGGLMRRREAESAIIEEWLSLPESERSTETQAAHFALQMKRKYPLDYVPGDVYLEIRRIMMRSQYELAG